MEHTKSFLFDNYISFRSTISINLSRLPATDDYTHGISFYKPFVSCWYEIERYQPYLLLIVVEILFLLSLTSWRSVPTWKDRWHTVLLLSHCFLSKKGIRGLDTRQHPKLRKDQHQSAQFGWSQIRPKSRPRSSWPEIRKRTSVSYNKKKEWQAKKHTFQ